jgi:hypothetical protein
MSTKRFLLWLLASIFTYQAGIFAYGFYKCSEILPETDIAEVCPDIGRRYDETFTLMVTSVIALITGSQLND